MSAYFCTDPYRSWFNTFEPLLNGLGASYYQGGGSRGLHTDICSPVATDPTWRCLDEVDRAALVADGGPLWHMLLMETATTDRGDIGGEGSPQACRVRTKDRLENHLCLRAEGRR